MSIGLAGDHKGSEKLYEYVRCGALRGRGLQLFFFFVVAFGFSNFAYS